MGGLLQNIKLPGDDIPWLEGLREKGRCVFAEKGLPTAKTEAWKYTRPRDLQADDFVLETAAGHECHCDENCDCEKASDEASALPFEAYELHFENGKLQHEHLHLPRGVTVMPLMDAILQNEDIRGRLGKSFDLQDYPFAALNTAYLEEGVFINIQENISPDKPLAIINHTHACHDNLLFNLRNVVVLEKNSRATIVEAYIYSGAEKSRYFANVVNEIYIGRGAELQHYKLQNDAYKAVHISLNAVKVKAGGNYEAFCLQRGADLARNETHVILAEEKARAKVDAAYHIAGWATVDTTTDIEHLAPETTSEQLVKGVAGGNAKGVFQGKIHIAPHAVKTEGNQLHKALLLTDEAEIDCKPELEIFADDVKCSHGAASGELDEEQLFYMRARGIGEDEARRILIDAYLEDVISRIEEPAVRDWITEQARQK